MLPRGRYTDTSLVGDNAQSAKICSSDKGQDMTRQDKEQDRQGTSKNKTGLEKTGQERTRYEKQQVRCRDKKRPQRIKTEHIQNLLPRTCLVTTPVRY